MGRATIESNDGVTSITCIRGPLSKMMSIVKDKLGNEYYCKYNKNDFKRLGDEYHLDVFNNKGILTKKFLKGFLTFVREIGDTEIVIEQAAETPKKIKATKVKPISVPVDDMDYEEPPVMNDYDE